MQNEADKAQVAHQYNIITMVIDKLLSLTVIILQNKQPARSRCLLRLCALYLVIFHLCSPTWCTIKTVAGDEIKRELAALLLWRGRAGRGGSVGEKVRGMDGRERVREDSSVCVCVCACVCVCVCMCVCM